MASGRNLTASPREVTQVKDAHPAEPTPTDPEPTWHQVAELPEFIAQFTEYQGHGRTCPCCSRVTVAKIPDDIRRCSVGPRLAAALPI